MHEQERDVSLCVGAYEGRVMDLMDSLWAVQARPLRTLTGPVLTHAQVEVVRGAYVPVVTIELEYVHGGVQYRRRPLTGCHRKYYRCEVVRRTPLPPVMTRARNTNDGSTRLRTHSVPDRP